MAKKPTQKKGKAAKLVKMHKDFKTADVHPTEVDNLKKSGWVECETNQDV